MDLFIIFVQIKNEHTIILKIFASSENKYNNNQS